MGKTIGRISHGRWPWKELVSRALSVLLVDGGVLTWKGYHTFPVLSMISKVWLYHCFLWYLFIRILTKAISMTFFHLYKSITGTESTPFQLCLCSRFLFWIPVLPRFPGVGISLNKYNEEASCSVRLKRTKIWQSGQPFGQSHMKYSSITSRGLSVEGFLGKLWNKGNGLSCPAINFVFLNLCPWITNTGLRGCPTDRTCPLIGEVKRPISSEEYIFKGKISKGYLGLCKILLIDLGLP